MTSDKTKLEKKEDQINPKCSKGAKIKIKLFWPIIIILLIICIGIGICHHFMAKKLIAKYNTEKEQVIAKASFNIDNNTKSFLETTARVFSWAINDLALKKNFEQINNMMTELVKTNNFKQIVLLSPDGKVVLSTDKKFEGQGFPSYINDMIKKDNVSSGLGENGELVAVAPVYNLGTRLCTVIITYTPQKINF